MSESRREIDPSPDVQGYFSSVVEGAVRARGIETSEATKQYIAGLLGDSARGALSLDALDRPLTLSLQDALDDQGATRFERLRRIGDVVLYALGFFEGCLTRRGADARYVMVVGSSAYGHAASMLRLGGTGSATDVLGELAERYGRFVEVMREIADGSLFPTADDTGVLRLYERWRSTGSPRLASDLAALGLCPVRGTGAVH